MDLSAFFQTMLSMRASDLHLSSAAPPAVRVDGNMQFLPLPNLQHEELEAKVLALADEQVVQQYRKTGQGDFAFENQWGRFRVNVFQTLRGVAAAFRFIPQSIPDLQTLGLPASLLSLTRHRQGLVLVTGATGSGKSTTLAALIHAINQQQQKHILTLEDPIEFIHYNQQSLVNQREIHRHSCGFSDALRAALREDPDVILVGEMRDAQTIALALTAAETGHLVFATLHSNHAPASIDRIIDSFDAAEKNLMRTMLAESLRAIITQTLLPRCDGLGRVAACEILYATPAVKNLIRENKIAQLHSVLQTSAAQGMQTLSQSLHQLFLSGKISQEVYQSYLVT